MSGVQGEGEGGGGGARFKYQETLSCAMMAADVQLDMHEHHGRFTKEGWK